MSKVDAMKEAAWNTVRPDVRRFAHHMEAVLQANDHKGGWQGMKLAELFLRLEQELRELRDDIVHDKPGADIRKEACDVANFAMMIFSNTLPPRKGKTLCEVFANEPKPKCTCCARGDEYNGFGSDGPTSFTCPKHCPCHD